MLVNYKPNSHISREQRFFFLVIPTEMVFHYSWRQVRDLRTPDKKEKKHEVEINELPTDYLWPQLQLPSTKLGYKPIAE